MSKIWNLSEHKDNIALKDEYGNALTYEQLSTESKILAEIIGKRVLVFSLCRNEIGSVLGYVGFINNGIVPVLLNSHLEENLLSNLLTTYEPSYLWVPKDQVEQFTDTEVKYEKYGYALDDDMKLDVDGVKEFLEKFKGQKILLFGFTFMIWQHFYKELLRLKDEGITFDLSNGILIHGGGWKKLISEAVKDKQFLYINEPWLIDRSLLNYPPKREPDTAPDNIRIYLPLDLNRDAILRRIDHIIAFYGEANEGNELNFSVDIGQVISQIEIYDQVWFARHMPESGKHSREAVELVKEVVKKLESIPDGCAEWFPFQLIDELKDEYLQ